MPWTDGRAGVRGKARFTHVMYHFGRDVRRKRFSAHRKLHSMEIAICKDHAAEKPRAGTEGGAGIGSRKEGTHAVGRTGGILRPRAGRA